MERVMMRGMYTFFQPNRSNTPNTPTTVEQKCAGVPSPVAKRDLGGFGGTVEHLHGGDTPPAQFS